MKKLFYILCAIIIAAAFTGCQIENTVEYDHTPPAPPTGIYTVTGDNRVDISWRPNTERDVAGYNVYYSDSYDGKYTLIGSTESDYFIDYGAENGITCYYAVTAYDYDGNESELSEDVAYDTPRPEGFNQSMNNSVIFPGTSGYDFSHYTVRPWDDDNTDMFFEKYQGIFYLSVWKDSDIQDMGPTRDIYDITEAPESGWAESKSTEAIIGHTYVIWTWDNHFAKVRVNNITNERVVFDWAYQTSQSQLGHRELKVGGGRPQRGSLDRSFHTERVKNRTHA